MSKPIFLNRNENPYGPSPLVLKTIHNFKSDHASRYLEGYYTSSLIQKISKIFKINPNRIILYFGIEDFIRNLFSELDPQKDSILTNEKCFGYFEIFAQFKNLKLHLFNLDRNGDSFIFDIKDCIQKIKKHKPKVVIITTPNNPTGNKISFSDLEKIIRHTPKSSLFLVDETYCGFFPGYEEKKLRQFIDRYPNIIFLRTFSKFYGLAGLRVGFGFCGQDFKKMIGYQNRFLNFSRILEEAAIAALDSRDFYKKTAKKICADRDWLVKEINQLKNFHAYKSFGSFIYVATSPRYFTRLEKEQKNKPVIIWKKLDQKSFRISINQTKYLEALVSSIKLVDKI